MKTILGFLLILLTFLAVRAAVPSRRHFDMTNYYYYAEIFRPEIGNPVEDVEKPAQRIGSIPQDHASVEFDELVRRTRSIESAAPSTSVHHRDRHFWQWTRNRPLSKSKPHEHRHRHDAKKHRDVEHVEKQHESTKDIGRRLLRLGFELLASD